MAEPFVLARDAETYENLRRDFVETAQKPTMAELAEKFSIPLGTVYRRASEENWNEKRAAFLQRMESEGDAKSLILQALARTEPQVMRAFTDVVIVGLQQLTMALSQIPETQASSTKCQTISTASFAFKNLADGCRAIGIVSFTKALDQLGKEANGKWDPEMLKTLNLQINNIVQTGEQAKPVPKPPTEVE